MNSNDRDNRRQNPDDLDLMLGDTLGMLARLAGTTLGLLLIAVGGYYALSLIITLLRVASDPGGVGAVVDAWTKAVGPGALEVKTNDFEFDGSRLVAILGAGGVVLIAGWLLMSLVRCGAEVVSITTSDKKAIQRVLKAALGKNDKSR